MRNRSYSYKYVGAAFVALIAVLGCTQALLDRRANQGGEIVYAPIFEVDPLWPRPLPDQWLLGMTIGVWVDEQDHVWVIHRSSATLSEMERGAEVSPPTGECCRGAPPVLVFDQAGNLVRHWGGPGPGYEWPESNRGIFVDHKGNVWIGGNGAKDAHVLKFTKDGKFLLQVGRYGNNKGSNDLENFGRVAKIFVDPQTNEAFLADGYGNRRVAVLDADTGDVSNDGFVDVCDRQANRLQVFTKDGKFVKEQWYARCSLREGSVWDIAFSRDPQQRYIFMADGRNQRVRIILRETLDELTYFGDGGRQPGQFFGVHSIATDSKGNLYTTETYEGKRLQKFVYKGVGPVRRGSQGVPWPRSG